jgi:hypothetical protein
MSHAWIAFKMLLSAVLVTFAMVIALGAAAAGSWQDPMAYASVALFFFLAALPWAIPITRPSRMAALVCIFVAILCLVPAYEAFFGELELPKDCSSYRRKLGCHMINVIYEVSGSAGVAVLWLSTSALLLWGAFILIRRLRNARA